MLRVGPWFARLTTQKNTSDDIDFIRTFNLLTILTSDSMKRSLTHILFSISPVALFLLAAMLMMAEQPSVQYQARSAQAEPVGAAAGAMSYIHLMRANGVTGAVSPQDVMNARAELNAMQNKTTSLTWESKGPDNYGGRTRCLLVDKNNSNKVYAGSVGGGLYRSVNGGSTWNVVSSIDANNAVVSICQASNGDIYYGTGEVFMGYGGSGQNTSPNFIGGGVYKSTDGGNTFSHLSATAPNGSNGSANWASVADMEAHPTDANTLYAATNKGLMRTIDGGATWSTIVSGNVQGMAISATGNLICSTAGRTMYSTDGGSNFSEISTPVITSTSLPRRTGGRMRYAISPQDANYIYVVQTAGNKLSAVYRSTDGGTAWSKIAQRSANFDPLCSGSGPSQYCQGVWDLLFHVSSTDKDRIWLGGIKVWTWSLTGGWSQTSTNFGGNGNPFYLHSDSHEMISDPNNAAILYTSNDGGVFKSNDNGISWVERNLGYNTFQFYRMGLGRHRELIGGTQDNGTILVDGSGISPNNGSKLRGGDGGFADMSWLNPNLVFAQTLAEKALLRSNERGAGWSAYISPFMNLATLQGLPFANWTIPHELWETTNDPGSLDTIHYQLLPSLRSMGYGDGIKKVFTGKMRHAQVNAQYVTDSFKVVAGPYTLVADANGNLTGDGTGVFHADSAYFEVTFNTAPLAEVILTCDVFLTGGTDVVLPSAINALPVEATLSTRLDVGDVFSIQDPIQSTFFVGLSSWSTGSFPNIGGIFMTRDIHDFSSTPEWWQVAHLGVGTTPNVMKISDDGDHLFVGTTNGRLYRISNINAARDARTASIDSSSTYVLTVTQIGTFPNRVVTDVDIDPSNANRVVVSLGNYGNTNFIYYSSNGLSTSPSFLPKQGNLPHVPTYSVSFDKGNPSRLIAGTEMGIFMADNGASGGTPTWVEENTGLGRVAVFDMEQYRTNENYDSNATHTSQFEGDLFIATHGRGFYHTTSTQVSRPVGMEEPQVSQGIEGLGLFPNPAVSQVHVPMASHGKVIITLRDLEGRLIQRIDLNRVPGGVEHLTMDLTKVAAGTYVITRNQDGMTASEILVKS